MFNRLKEILNKIKNLNSIISEYQKDTIIQSLPTLAHVNRAKKLILRGKIDEAEEVLNKALEIPHKDALVYKYLGIVYDCKKDFESAIKHFQTSADLNPNDKEIWRKLGFALLSFGKYENAEKSFENADKIQCLNTDNMTGWGMALMKQGKFPQAHEKFLKAITYNKYNYPAIFLCSVMEIKMELYDKAEMRLRFLNSYRPNESYSFEYARLKAIKEDYNGAINLAKKALEFNSNMLPAYILLGQMYAHNFDVENSLKNFKTAEEKDLINENLYIEWGKALLKFCRFKEAQEKLERAYEITSKNIEGTSYLALCKVINCLDATDLADEVSKIEPENEVIKQVRGITAFNNGDKETAVKLLKNTENALNSYYLAKCKENPKEDFENAIRLNPIFTQAYIDYTKYLISVNEFEQAQRKLRKALKTDENNLILLNLLFYVSYILVKDKVCEYNVKETISIAEKIENIDREKFEYPNEKAELLLTIGK